MSCHSRSSSEVCTTELNVLLPIFFRDFKHNFDFDDIKSNVKDLFEKEELQAITSEINEEKKLVRLFSVLCSKKELIIQKFLECIKKEYYFLVNGIFAERDSPSKLTLMYIDNINHLRSSYPKHTDFSIIRVDLYVRLRHLLRKLKPYHSVTLDGELGIGKKWLALSVCQDFDVMKAMNFQIYWLDVTNCTSPEQDVHFLQTLRLMLGGSSPSHSPSFLNGSSSGSIPGYQEYNESIFNRKLELQQCIRKKLKLAEHRECLIILKNVPNFKTYETFNLGAKLLLITRNKKIGLSLSPKMSTILTIKNGLTEMEFFLLFEKYVGEIRCKFPKNAIEIYKYSQGHPLLLSIVAQNLRQKKSNWQHWIGSKEGLEIPKNKTRAIVDKSLGVLTKERLKLYATLAVFPHSVPIPVKLLSALWDISLIDAKEIIQRFNKYSFVSIEPCPNDTEDDYGCCCILPFIYSEHLKSSEKFKSLINSKELHIKIINYYDIEQTFHQRTETDLCNSQHDHYFFNYIGYHLEKAERDRWFPIIFLDFGFLEQKIRAVGLSNTIGDLNYFKEKITDCDSRRRELLSELCEFLPKVEEKLIDSKDTSLLQYALMASGAVYEEATRQIRKFVQRAWFNERGSFHKRRQIVKLENQAKFVHILDQDICLLVLKNNNMVLLDISLDCTNDCLLLKNDETRNASIIDLRLYDVNNKKFIITLDVGGALKVWSIADEHQQSLIYRRSSIQKKVNAPNYHPTHKTRARSCKQRIKEDAMGRTGQIVAFYIEQLSEQYDLETRLHVAFSNGNISVFIWDPKREEFVPTRVPILETKAEIKFISKILRSYYIILTKDGSLNFWCLRDFSKRYVNLKWPSNSTAPISYDIYTYDKTDSKGQTYVIYIFAAMVLRLTFMHDSFVNQLDPQVEILYESSLESKDGIACAKLSNDQNYLFLGTERGLIVYDIHSKSEVLRSNVSETIACIDMYPLDDKIFKYIIICGAENREVLNILAVRRNEDNALSWAHNVTSMGNETSSDPQLETDVWLLGGSGLFDICYKKDGSTLLLAVDSKNRVHQVNTTKTKSWTIIVPSETKERITAIITGKERSFVAYNNGNIFNINKETLESHSMKGPVNFLQLFDDCHLIASTATETSIMNVCSSESKVVTYEFNTSKCYKIFENYILLISINGLITLLDYSTPKYCPKPIKHGLIQHPTDMYTLRGSDYQMGYLCLATTTFINVFRLVSEEEIKLLKPFYKPQNHKYSISCVALARDASLIAAGFENGDIEVFKFPDDYIPVYKLQSHHNRVHDIKFSTCNKVLVSCADQLCFWSVNFLLNNPLIAQPKKRRSSRFASQLSRDVEEVDARVIAPQNNHLSVNYPQQQSNTYGNDGDNDVFPGTLTKRELFGETQSVWSNKQGPADKPELLACIKFDGNKAERFYANRNFTQFSTIDDEGVYYNLDLLDVAVEVKGNVLDSLNIEKDTMERNSITYCWREDRSGVQDPTPSEDAVYI